MSEISDTIELQTLYDLDGAIVGLWAKGWHDPAVLIAAGRERGKHITAPNVFQRYWRCVPIAYNDDRMMMFTQARGPGRGAFQVTVWEGESL